MPPFPHLISPLQHMPCIRFKLSSSPHSSSLLTSQPPTFSPTSFPPTSLLPTSFSSPPFPYQLSPPSRPPQERKHNAHHCHHNEKALGPIIALSQHSTQKHPKAPPTCPNTSKQALTTSPVKHLLPFSSMLYVSFQAPYLRAAKTQKPALFPLELAFL